MEAAVWAGADAVYFGLDQGLNARVRATSFQLDALLATMDYLHERGVRGYLTLNTLVFDEELAQAEQLIRAAAVAGVDALIVQDIGLAQLARRVAPKLPIHGSTQMSITDAAGVAFAAQLGCKRVVLGRELSIDDITRIGTGNGNGVEIEVFVHGALCVSYSGQCFSSEAWGGRSANRGQCAQACRLPYGLIVDGDLRDQGDMRYLLSPQDLMALEQLPRLVRAGVRCFKIEGRLKGPEYVLATVTAYREAVDRIHADMMSGHSSTDAQPLAYAVDSAQRHRLVQAFARGQSAEHDGLTPGFLEGPRHQSLVIGRNPKHRGVFVGTVEGVTGTGIRTVLRGPLKRGDGLVFDRGRPDGKELGGNVFEIVDDAGRSVTGEIVGGQVELRFAKDFAVDRIASGTLLWRTRDSAQDGTTHLEPRLAARPVAVKLSVSGSLGEPLTLCMRDQDGNDVSVEGSVALQRATGKPLDGEKIRKAIGTLGDTPFVIAGLHIDRTISEQPLFLPPAQIKALRRMAVDRLLEARRRHNRAGAMAASPVLPGMLPTSTAAALDAPRATPDISLLCRTQAQVDAALQLDDVDEIVLDFLEVHGLKDACIAVRRRQRRLIVAAPRIFKPGEQRLWRYYCRLQPDALLMRSAGLLWQLHELGGEGAMLDDGETVIPALHGDFSLNAANVLGVRQLLAMGLQRLTLTHDLNGRQITALTHALPEQQRQRIRIARVVLQCGVQ